MGQPIAPPTGPAPAAGDRPPRRWGVLVGLVAAAAGLAAAEFVAGFARSLRSPVVSVGDRVVDLVPPAVKNLAIERSAPPTRWR